MADEGVTITYQGKLCGTQFELTRPAGLEPGFGSVFCTFDEFQDYRIDEGLSGVDVGQGQNSQAAQAAQTAQALDAQAQALANAPGVPDSLVQQFRNAAAAARAASIQTVERQPTAKRGWQSAGDLVFSETINSGPASGTHEVRIRKVLVTERAVESAFAFDDENDLCHIEITDIRYLWESRGVVFGWINVPKNGLGLPIESETGQITLGTTGGAELFIKGSTNKGTPWTLREVLEQKVLPNLPGNPKLNYISDDVASKNPIGHIWLGIRTKHALKELLDEFQLVMSLDLDSNVSFWKKDEGAMASGASVTAVSVSATGRGNEAFSVVADTSHPDVHPAVASSWRLVSYKWIPSVFVVLGPPVIVTEKIKLEPVGEMNGQILPLRDALTLIGMPFDKAQAYALARYSDRSALPFGVTIDGLREFQRWAFKWYRIPGGSEKNADKLPILDARGSINSVGQLHPPKVYSESHTVVNIFATKLGEAQSSIIKQQVAAQGKIGVSAADKQAAVDKARELLSSADPKGYLVTHNIPFAEQSEGWELDAARGIVKFKTVQGLAQRDGVTLDSFTAVLADSASVELEFSHTLKPKWEDDISADHCYKSVWIRGQGGTATKADQIPPGSAPKSIDRPDLQEIRQIDGTTNKGKLDEMAKALAEEVFKVPQSQKGAVVTFARPVPVQNTGQALSIKWSTDDERPRTEVHINTVAPLTPPPGPRTLAFGFVQGRNRNVDSVFAPRGVRN